VDRKDQEGGMNMTTFTSKDQDYDVDSKGFLINFKDWDGNFAQGMAEKLGLPRSLSKEHWNVINFIHNTFKETGRCPLVYETCQTMGLSISQMRSLFPTGYLRGACKLAGIPGKGGHLGLPYHPTSSPEIMDFMKSYNKTYEVDVRGFLVNPEDWDEQYAVYRAYDMKIDGGKLTEKHWEIIRYLRECYKKNSEVPTVYETCEANQINLRELEQLFPDGYHRGAVKIAGLRVT
jgi:tRNA 2-thiouridine synthesizing protein E